MSSDQNLRPDPEMDHLVGDWLNDTDLSPTEGEQGLARVLDEFPVTPQSRRRFLGRWFERDEGARRRTDEHDHPPDHPRRTRLMFSATGLVAAFAVLALTVNVVTTDESQPPAAGSGATHVVAADGSGDYSTIGEAVAAASDGDTVMVQPGTYTEAIIIDKDISLIGDGPVEQVIIEAPADGPTYELSPDDFYSLLLRDLDNATVSGLTFRGEPSTVIVSGGSPTVQNSVFDSVGWAFGTRGMGSLGSSIHVNDGSAPTIVGNSLVDGGPIGVFAESTPEISSNALSGGPHIFLSSFGDGTVVADNSIDGTNLWAVGVFDVGELEITGNTISEPGMNGVVISFGSALVTGNTVSGATAIAVAAEDTGTRVIGNVLMDNAIGIGGPVSVVESNELTGGGAGIVVTTGSPSVKDNSVTGMTGRGITISAGTSATLSGNSSCNNETNFWAAPNATWNDEGTNEFCEDAPAE